MFQKHSEAEMWPANSLLWNIMLARVGKEKKDVGR